MRQHKSRDEEKGWIGGIAPEQHNMGRKKGVKGGSRAPCSRSAGHSVREGMRAWGVGRSMPEQHKAQATHWLHEKGIEHRHGLWARRGGTDKGGRIGT